MCFPESFLRIFYLEVFAEHARVKVVNLWHLLPSLESPRSLLPMFWEDLLLLLLLLLLMLLPLLVLLLLINGKV